MQKSKLAAFISLLLVFVSGSVLGWFAHRVYLVKATQETRVLPPPNRRPDPEQVRREVVAEMKEVLKLDDAQLAQLNQIYDDTRDRFDQIHKKNNNDARQIWDDQVKRIKEILRPEQIPLYDQLREKHERERKTRRGPGPPPGERRKQ